MSRHFPNLRPFPDMVRPGWDWDDEDDDGYGYDDRQFHNGGSAPHNEQEQQQPQQQQQPPQEYFMRHHGPFRGFPPPTFGSPFRMGRFVDPYEDFVDDGNVPYRSPGRYHDARDLRDPRDPRDPREQQERPSEPATKTKAHVVPIRVIHESPPGLDPGRAGRPAEAKTEAKQPSVGLRPPPRVERSKSEPPGSLGHHECRPTSPQAVKAKGDNDNSLAVPLDAANKNLVMSSSSPNVPDTHEAAEKLARILPKKENHAKMPLQRQNQKRQTSPDLPPPRQQPQRPQRVSADSALPAGGVRNVPIFVEGRREPVQRRATVDPSQYRSPSDYYPNVRKVPRNYERHEEPLPQRGRDQEPTSPIGPPPGPIPMGYVEPPHQQHQKQPPQDPTSPLPCPEGPIPMGCSPDFFRQSEPAPAESPPRSEPEQVAPPPAQSQTGSSNPSVAKVEQVRAAVAELQQQIEAFRGHKSDKEYLFLDEMLTRNLIQLDDLDTNGRDDLRQLRKDTIRTINRCASMLEKRASAQKDADDNNRMLDALAAQSEAEANGMKAAAEQNPKEEAAEEDKAADPVTNVSQKQ